MRWYLLRCARPLSQGDHRKPGIYRPRVARRGSFIAQGALTAILAFVGSLSALPVSAQIKTPVTPAVAAQQIDRSLLSELPIATDKRLAPRVNDEVFLRRASLDLIGTLPSPSEVTLFVLDPTSDKRTKLIERLLADERFGSNWARYWRDVIMYRRSEDRALLVAGPLEQFLTEQLNQGVGWDKIAQAFVTAHGNVTEHGEAALFMAQAADASNVASEFSRIFMGVQIQCAQCHDHPTDRWKREQFHEFAAFFPRVTLRPVLVDGKPRGFELASNNFGGPSRGMGGGRRGSLEHHMPDLKDPASDGRLMTPVFFATQQKLSTGVKDLDRRETLAQWMTAPRNEWFAKAFVNRVWAELIGEGFYEPVDDLGPDRTATAPRTLAYLAEQFTAHQYDVKWLYRAIMNTTSYERESRPRRHSDQTPFVANVAQRLRGDQLYDVLIAALGIDPGTAPMSTSGAFMPRFGGPRSMFNATFGYDPSVRRDEVAPTIPQALFLMNAQLINRTINGHSGATMLGRVLEQFKSDELAIVELYLRCLAREPNADELKVGLEHIKATAYRVEAFEDLLWAIVNRTEFIHRN